MRWFGWVRRQPQSVHPLDAARKKAEEAAARKKELADKGLPTTREPLGTARAAYGRVNGTPTSIRDRLARLQQDQDRDRKADELRRAREAGEKKGYKEGVTDTTGRHAEVRAAEDRVRDGERSRPNGNGGYPFWPRG